MLALSLMPGCAGRNEGRPSGAGGAAFVMCITPAACRSGHGACFDATIKNLGPGAGSGHCEIHGFSDGTGDRYVARSRVAVSLASGASESVSLAWDGPPEKTFTGYCTPGLRA